MEENFYFDNSFEIDKLLKRDNHLCPYWGKGYVFTGDNEDASPRETMRNKCPLDLGLTA